MDNQVPIYCKMNLSIKEAAEYSNIGEQKLRQIISQPNCKFVLYVGRKILIKRKEFEKWNETVKDI